MPSSSSHVVISHRLFLHEDKRVGELIDINAMCWKSSVMDSIFLPHEVEAIKSILLSVRFNLDKLVWAETANGKFTVKSAYHLAVKLLFSENRGSASNCRLMRRFRRSLWRLPIPHKVRHFAWKACREALPTKVNLRRRKVLTDDSCEWCKEEPETVGHVLWSCLRAQEVWECSKLVLSLDRRDDISFMDTLWQLLLAENVNLDSVSRLVMIAWKLWHSRNELHLNGVMKSGKELVYGALHYWAEFLAANDSDEHSSTVV